jgi:uncharacterized protein (TIGR02145 family)
MKTRLMRKSKEHFYFKNIVALFIGFCLVVGSLTLNSCGPVPVDTLPTPKGFTLKVNLTGTAPSAGVILNIPIEVSDENGVFAEKSRIIYIVRSGGGTTSKTEEILTSPDSFNWNLGRQFGKQTIEINAYKSDTGTEHVNGSPLTLPVNTLTVKDVDGNIYNTVQIGNQVWMGENLYTTKYRNGTPLKTGLDSIGWSEGLLGAYAPVNGDPATDKVYGRIYNWYAIDNPIGLCPKGWHVPSGLEWSTLINKAGGVDFAGRVLKSSDYWNSPSAGTDSLGFGLPGTGYLTDDFKSLQFRSHCLLWSSDTADQSPFFTSDWQGIFYSATSRLMTIPCRCIQD